MERGVKIDVEKGSPQEFVGSLIDSTSLPDAKATYAIRSVGDSRINLKRLRAPRG